MIIRIIEKTSKEITEDYRKRLQDDIDEVNSIMEDFLKWLKI